MFSPPKLDLSNSGLEEFQQPEFEGYGPKEDDLKSKVVKKIVESKTVEQDGVSKTVSPTMSKMEFVRPKKQEKLVRKTVKYAEMY
ncbi:hypothetical protein Tco_1116024, partial [Tanacetum coccineum]